MLTVHIVGLDSVQHAHGPLPGSAEAHATLEHLDATIGRIIAAEREAYPNAVIAIASDHGFHPVTANVHLNAALSAAGLITLDADGKLVSWKAYAWNSGGSASVVLKDPGDAVSRTMVDQVLDGLAADPSYGIATILRDDAAHAQGALPQASYVVDFRSGFASGGGLSGAIVTPRTAVGGGAHGYLNTHPGMHSSFFVMGPGIQAGKNLGQIDIRSIAPTLAKELDVDMPDATFPVLQLRAGR